MAEASGRQAFYSEKRINLAFLGAQVNPLQHPATSKGRKVQDLGDTWGSFAALPNSPKLFFRLWELLGLSESFYHLYRKLLVSFEFRRNPRVSSKLFCKKSSRVRAG
jgi:hypothetical protein